MTEVEKRKYEKARKNVIIGGAVILIAITVLSSVSSYMIYQGGFADVGGVLQGTLSIFAVLVVEGAFIWLVYGFTRAFSSAAERGLALLGMSFLVIVMLTNLVTHFMLVKNIPLNSFQQAWISWGAITVFIAVLLIVLCITLADLAIRLLRLGIRFLGKQQEKIIQAKTEGLESDRIVEAMAARAEWEAGQLAELIEGEGRRVRLNTPRPGFQAPPAAAQFRGEADEGKASRR